MSVQFGRWNFEGQAPDPDYIEKVSGSLAPYGPDSSESYSKDGVKILYRAFHTTKESRRETQPHVTSSGAVLTWDGRLDNREDLIRQLRDVLTIDATDVQIVAAAYEHWEKDCFAMLIGDWALTIWDPCARSLVLAKDPIGTRHLYYSFDNNQITWSTILDPLVLFAGKTFALNEEYIVGWLAILFPHVHLTPYVGIHSVPPSSSVLLKRGKHTIHKYWDFDPSKRIRYRTDAEYEEHFRAVFSEAVRRRLRSDRPVLAELSGGMDSSSIVCIADSVSFRGLAEAPRVDTISWYDDTYDDIEPDMNESPYFTKVEEKRGRSGHHINLRNLRAKEIVSETFTSDFDDERFAALPPLNCGPSEFFEQYAACLNSKGHRVVLSGIGGGEFTGDGVPTPSPELQNLMARARFYRLASRLKAWAAKMKERRVRLLWEAAQGFFPFAHPRMPEELQSTPLLYEDFISRNRAALRSYACHLKLFGPLPSFQRNIQALNNDRRALARFQLRSKLLAEVRYPYFDRGFLEFMFAIPREQIVGVGQRRLVMKRALIGIVPSELLNRRRKAPVQLEFTQDLRKHYLAGWPRSAEICQHMVSSSMGIIDPHRFFEALENVRDNEKVPSSSLRRAQALESWLRHPTTQSVLTNSRPTKRQDYSSPVETNEFHRLAQPKSSAS